MQLLCLETHTPEWQHQRPTVSSSQPPLRTLSQSSPENPIKPNQTRHCGTLCGNCAGLAECAKEPVWACAERLPQTAYSASTFEKAAYALQETFPVTYRSRTTPVFSTTNSKKQIEVRVLQRQQSTHLTIRKLTVVGPSTQKTEKEMLSIIPVYLWHLQTGQ